MTLGEYLDGSTLSQAEFGECVGLSQKTISKIVGGNATSLSVAIRIEMETHGHVRAEDVPLRSADRRLLRYLRPMRRRTTAA